MIEAQRVAILVDSENIEISVSEHYEPSAKERRTHIAYPDWLKIIPRVVAGRTVVRNIYYKERARRISKKFRALWERELSGEIKQPNKSADPYIIVDAVTLAEKADCVILLTGDKDYLPLIWYLKSKGCKVEIASFPDAASTQVKAAADRFYSLGEKDTIVLRKSELPVK